MCEYSTLVFTIEVAVSVIGIVVFMTIDVYKSLHTKRLVYHKVVTT